MLTLLQMQRIEEVIPYAMGVIRGNRDFPPDIVSADSFRAQYTNKTYRPLSVCNIASRGERYLHSVV